MHSSEGQLDAHRDSRNSHQQKLFHQTTISLIHPKNLLKIIGFSRVDMTLIEIL